MVGEGRDANTPGAAGAAEIQDEQGGNSAASTSAEVSIPTKQEAFLCHPSSHLVLHEEGAHEQLLGFAAQKVGVMEVSTNGNENGTYMRMRREKRGQDVNNFHRVMRSMSAPRSL